MKTQQRKWAIDALLFLGYLAAMLLDLTGLAVHQWLGTAVVALAGYHLIVHRQWLISNTKRLLGRTSVYARGLYLVDIAVLVGFLAIGVTGLAMSTWLDLSLASYTHWREVHVVSSVITLGMITLKIGLHWRWVLTSHCFAKTPLARHVAPQRTSVGRREFLRLMGAVGTAALLAGLPAATGHQAASAKAPATAFPAADPRQTWTDAPPPEPSPSRNEIDQPIAAPELDQDEIEVPAAKSPVPSPTVPAVPPATAETCLAQCPKGCIYPGRCRRYVDANGNDRCDLGECQP